MTTWKTERWTKETPYGTDHAQIIDYGGSGYYADLGCQMWNRYYKSYKWAKKYLEKSGYEKDDNARYDSLMIAALKLKKYRETKDHTSFSYDSMQFDAFASAIEHAYEHGELTNSQFNDIALTAFYDYDNLKDESWMD